MILSPFLSALSTAGGLKKYKSKIISFLLFSGNVSGHDIVVITLLSVILNRHKAIELFSKVSGFIWSKFNDSDVRSIKGSWVQSSLLGMVHSLRIEMIPLYIFE